MENIQEKDENLSERNKNTHHNNYFIKGIGLLLLVTITYFTGYQAGNKGFVLKPDSFKIINQNEVPKTVDYNLLWSALDVVNKKYIDKPLDQQKILYGSISGAVSSLGDPYTTFLPPKELTNFKTQLKGSFGGIGAEVGMKDGNIVIIAPLDESPAFKAGILAGDYIVSVDGLSTEGWAVDEAVEKIRGPKGTTVVLSIFRAGKEKPFEVKIVRDTIVIKSVKISYQDVEKNGKKVKIAVVDINEFGDDTSSLFKQAVNEILTKNVSGIIVDLRNNPGGYLQTAVDVASSWVKAGDLVVSEVHSDGKNQEYKAVGTARLSGIKTIVLINGGSASASEILAGALKDHNLATLMGEKSFGKGSVQELVDLPGGSAVKVTVAKWVTPNGKNLNKNGLDPDTEIKITEEDVKNLKDSQFDKALEEIIK